MNFCYHKKVPYLICYALFLLWILSSLHFHSLALSLYFPAKHILQDESDGSGESDGCEMDSEDENILPGNNGRVLAKVWTKCFIWFSHLSTYFRFVNTSRQYFITSFWFLSAPCTKRKKLAIKPVTKKSWSLEESAAIERHFSGHIKRNVAVKKNEALKCLSQEPNLSSRDWKAVKWRVKNQARKYQKKFTQQ